MHLSNITGLKRTEQEVVFPVHSAALYYTTLYSQLLCILCLSIYSLFVNSLSCC